MHDLHYIIAVGVFTARRCYFLMKMWMLQPLLLFSRSANIQFIVQKLMLRWRIRETTSTTVGYVYFWAPLGNFHLANIGVRRLLSKLSQQDWFLPSALKCACESMWGNIGWCGVFQPPMGFKMALTICWKQSVHPKAHVGHPFSTLTDLKGQMGIQNK